MLITNSVTKRPDKTDVFRTLANIFDGALLRK